MEFVCIKFEVPETQGGRAIRILILNKSCAISLATI